jgi:hypothetical protein
MIAADNLAKESKTIEPMECSLAIAAENMWWNNG